ncbi:hypothetical protein AB0D57_42400 [Streptomyces sp. NPDC048275]|uniref:hypothetical protein n=1 Tax=Streptomyces sp. NPDC048275 TaxID=3155629 RepID=UPI0033DE9AB5
MTTASYLETSIRAAAAALESGAWLIRQPDMDAALVIWERLWTPFSDVLEAEQADPARVRTRLETVPAACEAAVQVPGIDDQFTELLQTLTAAIADVEQDQAVRLLGNFGTVVSAVGNGPEMWA